MEKRKYLRMWESMENHQSSIIEYKWKGIGNQRIKGGADLGQEHSAGRKVDVVAGGLSSFLLIFSILLAT